MANAPLPRPRRNPIASPSSLRTATIGLVAIATLASLIGCHSVPMTGRKQLLLVSEDKESTMGAQAFEETLLSERPSQNQQYVTMVHRVGQRLAAAANRPDFDWEFRVVQSPEQNAFCLPGGKVAVYEGILPICQTETGLAVVMAHEVAHALARHGAERVSHGYMVDGVGNAINLFTQKHATDAVQKVAQGYGVASNYGFVLPYSRKHESEADEIGIMLMARAGYDPAEAPRFWQRFASVKTGGQTPEFLSTHPSDERRARDLQEQLANAVALYQRAPQKFGMGEALVFGVPPRAPSLPESRDQLLQQPSPLQQPLPTLSAMSEETRIRRAALAEQHRRASSAVQQASATESVRERCERLGNEEFGSNPLR